MDRRVQLAIEIMHGRKHQSLAIRDLARQVNLSSWHFIHLFKAETSVAPKKYLRDIRLKEAETLLKHSFLTVKEITSRVGFRDRSHFSRDFKNMFGQAPSNFRNGRRLPAARQQS